MYRQPPPSPNYSGISLCSRFFSDGVISMSSGWFWNPDDGEEGNPVFTQADW